MLTKIQTQKQVGNAESS